VIRLLVISPRDNVATALEPLSCGDIVEVLGHALRIGEAIPRGHKVALAEISTGASVIKYGSAIGVASAPIAVGMHVHTHNLASVRGRGDLVRATATTEARIAEPPDSDVIELPAEEPR
jgi:altronate dehydratase